jgi:hypothetical protein
MPLNANDPKRGTRIKWRSGCRSVKLSRESRLDDISK